ncbi:MAG TPA: hypothetical protein VGN26_12240 [Armatimonadota bacterium]|jgi:hypothetical protein
MTAVDQISPYLKDAWLWARVNPWQGVAAAIGIYVLLKYALWLSGLFRLRG